jgi:hypothetical protein
VAAVIDGIQWAYDMGLATVVCAIKDLHYIAAATSIYRIEYVHDTGAAAPNSITMT